MKKSFFQRIAESLKPDTLPEEELYRSQYDEYTDDETVPSEDLVSLNPDNSYADEDGQLAVDVYEVDDVILVKTMIAGVRKVDLDINVTRQQVTIQGARYDQDAPSDEFYVHQELYWGSFSRTIDLPEEVDIDRAKAMEERGLLVLQLPKVDKHRSTKLELDSKKK